MNPSKEMKDLIKKYGEQAAKLKLAADQLKQASKRMREMMTNQEKLEQCIDTKGQQVVSIKRVAEVLGVKAPSKKDIEKLVESRK